jgi:hypothetical protein
MKGVFPQLTSAATFGEQFDKLTVRAQSSRGGNNYPVEKLTAQALFPSALEPPAFSLLALETPRLMTKD